MLSHALYPPVPLAPNDHGMSATSDLQKLLESAFPPRIERIRS